MIKVENHWSKRTQVTGHKTVLRASQYSVIGLGDGGEPLPEPTMTTETIANLDVPVLREEEAVSQISSAYVHQCMWIFLPDQGSDLCSYQGNHGVLTTGRQRNPIETIW